MGIATSFLGTRGFLAARLQHGAFPSRLGTLQVSRALALIHTNYPMIYLGYETKFGSPGTGPDTLAPWVGQGGV